MVCNKIKRGVLRNLIITQANKCKPANLQRAYSKFSIIKNSN